VVGSWHLLPLLAERVSRAFAQYVGDNPSLHISAGIILEGRKFPLYQAATRAGKALDSGAKKYERTENGLLLKKNAVHFLGQTLGWEDLAEVREKADLLVKLAKREDVPRGLLQTLQMIYHRFLEDQKEARRRRLSGEQVYYGPWMWQQAYALGRLAHRYDKASEVTRDILVLQRWILEVGHIRYLGLAARWAEYLTRGKEG
jgi:CRISPR-associated protein Csm1